MRIFSFKRRTAVVIAAGSLALAAFGSSNSGLFAGLFTKDKCELPKRQPGGDCSFGYHRTSWRPWGTCCETPIPEFPGGTRYVPDSTYSPINTAPYSARPDLHGQTPIIIGPSPDGDVLLDADPSLSPENSQDLAPILNEPGYTRPSTNEGDPGGESQIPLPTAPNVRSIESQPAAPEPSAQPNTPPEQTRSSIEDPIRGLLPDPTYSQPRPSSPSQARPQAVTPPAAARSTTDYSEYIPLPTADSVPQSLPLPNPAARAGVNAGARPVQSAVPQSGPVFTDEEPPVDNVLKPNGLPMPQPGTRPDQIEAIDPDVSRYVPHSSDDRYRDYRPLQSSVKRPRRSLSSHAGFEELPSATQFRRDAIARASAQRFSGSTPRYQFDRPTTDAVSSGRRFEQSAADEIPEWRPMSNSARTSRSVAPQPGPEWRTLLTPAGRNATTATSPQRDRSSSLGPPPWRLLRSVR